MPIKSKALVLRNYYTHTHTYSATAQTPSLKIIISTAKLSKMERTVINIVMRNNRAVADMAGAVAG